MHTVVLTSMVDSGLGAVMAHEGLVAVGYAAALVLIVLASVAYTRYVDRPLYRWTRRLAGVGG